MDAELKKLLSDLLESNIATQKMVTEEIGGVKKEIKDIEKRVDSLQSTLQEYNNMKLQAKGIVGLIRLLWNVGIIGAIFAYLKAKNII